jgi:hypothetical protein
MVTGKARVYSCVLLVLLLLALTSTVWAQTPTGVIRGVVTDPTGAVIPSATVKIVEISTGRTINLKTNSDGIFVAPLLIPGEYRVEIQAPQFSATEQRATVQAGQTVNASVKMQLGNSSTTVEVSTSTAGVQVDTVRSTVDGVISGRQIDQIPLNARNFLELAAIQPGVQIADGGNIDPTKSATYRTIQILGRSGTGTRVTVDGIDITDETVGTTMANISDDAVQEFQLSQSSLDLSTSLTSSGAVNIVSRSGGNAIHGSAFEFYRNQDMGARLGFDPKVEPFHRHQVGFRVGGPFVKDKLFWFVNWERTYQAEQGSYKTDANFPTIAGHNCTTGCFGAVPLGIRMIDGRLDYNVKNNVRLFYRFGHDWNVSTGGSIPVSPFQNVDWNNNHTVGLDWSQRRLTHSFRFGYVKFNNRIISQSFAGFAFPTTPQGTPYNLSVGKYNLGPNGLAPQTTAQDNYDTKYDGSFVLGKHVLRYGFELNHIILGGFANFAGPLSISGDFSAANQAAIKAAGLDPTNPLNYPLSDFSGGPDNGFFTLGACDGFKYGCHKNNRIAWYVGDTFKLRQNLTLNFGTRWEYDTGYFNQESGITRPSYLNYWLPGTANHPSMGYNKFGPQFGFAWDPKGNGKTVIRGGGYMAYEMNIYNNLLFDQNALIPSGIGPDVYSSSYWGNPDGTPVTPAQAGLTLASLPASCQGALADMNGGDYTCLTEGGGNAGTLGSAVGAIGALNAAMKKAYAGYAFNPNSGKPQFLTSQGVTFGYLVGGSKYKIPYSLQWNIGMQREIKPGTVFTADLLINHGVHVGNIGNDFECRRCANTLNKTAAATKIGGIIGTAAAPGSPAWSSAVDAWIAAHPGKTISSFGLASDSIYQGRTPDPSATDPIIQSTNFIRARIMDGGGFSLYKGLQMSLKGRIGQEGILHGGLKNGFYQVSYALGSSQATNGAYRTEFLNGALNRFNPVDSRFFGPVPEDHRHMLTIGFTSDTFLGFRFSPFVKFYTPSPGTVNIPSIGVTGSNALFTDDLIGTGIIDSMPLPGTHIGDFGRGVNSWSALNKLISNYNTTYAGTLTPAGAALVSGGFFTKAQLTSLGAVMPVIPVVPTSNPWPFQNFFNVDLGISRPVHLNKLREGFSVEPWIQFFNVFNYNSLGAYGGLDTSFGSLNSTYTTPSDLDALRLQRGRQNSTRLFQIGVRVNF